MKTDPESLLPSPLLNSSFSASFKPSFYAKDETRTRYVKYIPASEFAGKTTLVFLPGWAGALEFWQYQLEYFSARAPTIAIDYPGCGGSFLFNEECGDPVGIFTMSQQAEIVSEILRREGVDSCILIGHSIGGALSLAVAAQNPDRVKAVIGADSLSYMDLYPAASEQVSSQFIQSLQHDFKTSVRALAENYFVDISKPEIVDWVSQTMSQVHQQTGLMVLEQFLCWDLATELDRYQGPVTIINSKAGYEKEAFESVFGERIDVTLIEGAGHFVMLDKPDIFCEQMVAHLDALGINT